MKTIYTLAVLPALLICGQVKAQLTATLTPVQDAYFISMGGGQGSNPILKFDISSLPAGSTILQANMMVYVYDTTKATNGTAHNGNMIFRNLNNKQGWTETDSAYKFSPSNNLYSDSVTQVSGFGDSIGWATSNDIKSIVIKDQGAANTYCTISMKDPDDVTCCGGMGPNFSQFLGNQADSIVAGNKMVGSDEMIFYPREYANPNLIPKLIIKYSCSVAGSQTLTLCAGDSVVVGTHVHKTNGIYNDTLTSIAGCDSIVTSDITFKPAINITVSVAGNVISSNEAGAVYQWIDCSSGHTAINGEINQTYTVSSSGSYAVAITKNGCSDTSACTNMVFTNVGQLTSSRVSVHPNPVHDLVTVDLNSETAQLVLSDMLGRTVYQADNASGKTQVDLRNENKGIFLLKVTTNGASQFLKIVKE